MKLLKITLYLVIAAFSAFVLPLAAQSPYASLQVPKQIQYQGRVATATGGAWSGPEGYFSFALVQGATILWNNWEGTASPSDPGTVSLGAGQVLTLPVPSGVFSIRLGEGSDSNEQIPATVFFDSTSNAVRAGVKLAVWFSPDGGTFTRLSPDVEFTSVPFAMVAGIAETVKERAVTQNMLASTAAVPVGAVIAWWGSISDIPSGFEPCDGNAPTTPGATLSGSKPNLLGRFPRGSASADVKTSPVIGGLDIDPAGLTGSTTLDLTQIPTHSHTFSANISSSGLHSHSGSTDVESAHTHKTDLLARGASGSTGAQYGTDTGSTSRTTGEIGEGAFNSGGATRRTGPVATTASNGQVGHLHTFSISSSGAHTHTVTGTTDNNTGGNQGHTHTTPAHDNRPAYLELIYIIRVK